MRRLATWLLIAAALLLVFSLALAQAGEYDLPWHRVAGGGGVSNGDQYVLSGTIGQHEAGVLMESPGFRLSGGYWGRAIPSGSASFEVYLPVIVRPG